ncbi:MAG: TAL effector repeat-containing protein, partial [Legionellaceae bacterium]|nr:TAL effector repeat-containing protein [Legionellaceae bacterium]
SNGGGAQALKTVCKTYQELQDIGFTKEQIVAMAAHDGGAQALKIVISHASHLLQNGHSLEKITALAARRGGARKIYQALSYILLEDIENPFEILDPPNNTHTNDRLSLESFFYDGQQDEEHEEMLDDLDDLDDSESFANLVNSIDDAPKAPQYDPNNPHNLFTAPLSKRSYASFSEGNASCNEENPRQQQRTHT